MGLFMKILFDIRTLDRSEGKEVDKEDNRAEIIPHRLKIQHKKTESM